MAEEQALKYDPDNLVAMAQGILESAPDVITGKTALVEAYNSYNWSDPKKALDIVERYGEKVRNYHQDQTPLQDVNVALPISLQAVVKNLPADANDFDMYNTWEKVNKEALANNTDPIYAVNKPLLLKQMAETASAGRRDANKAVMEDSPILGGYVDVANRAARGLETGLGLNAVSHELGYDLNNWFTEYTDPAMDDNFTVKAVEGVTGAVGVAASFAVPVYGVAIGTANIVNQAGQGTYSTYAKTLENTGSSSQAIKAAEIEGASQLVQLGAGALVGKAAVKPVTAEAATIWNNTVGKRVVGQTIAQGVLGATGKAISNQAENIQNTGVPGQDQSAMRGVLEAGAIGAIAGGVIQGAVEITPPKPRVVTGPGNDPTIRQREIDATGAPETTQIKQIVGDLFAPERPPPGDEPPPPDAGSGPIASPRDVDASAITSLDPSSDGGGASAEITLKAAPGPNAFIAKPRKTALLDLVDSLQAELEKNQEEYQSLRTFNEDTNTFEAKPGKEEALKQNLARNQVLKERLQQRTEELDALFEEAIPEASQAVVDELQNQPVEPIEEKTPVFTTDKKQTFYDDKSGVTEDGRSVNASDKQLFVDEATHTELTKQISEGGHVYLNEKGEPVLETKSLVEGEIKTEVSPVTNYSSEPATGSYVWNVNEQKSPIPGQIVRQVSSGGKVVTVHDIPMKSAGAQQREFDKLTQLSQKVLASDIVTDENKIPVGMYVEPNAQTAADAASMIKREGLDTIYNKVINDLPSVGTNLEQQGAIGYLIQNFKAGIQKAVTEGNTAEFTRLNKELGDFLGHVNTQGTDIAQALQYRGNKEAFPLESLKRTQDAYQQGVESHVAGRVEEIQKLNEEVAVLRGQLEKAKSELTPPITPEENAVVEEVRTKAEKSYEQDTKTIDDRIATVESQIKEAEKAQMSEKAKERKLESLNKKLVTLQGNKEKIASVEDRADQNITYKKIQTRREEALKENKTRLTAAEKAYNESVAKKQKLVREATEAGVKRAAEQSIVEDRIQKLNELKNNKESPLTPAQRKEVDNQISLLETNSTKGPERMSWFGYWARNVIGTGINSIVAFTTSGVLGVPLAVKDHLGSSTRALFNNLARGSLTQYEYPLLSFFKGMFDKTTSQQALTAAAAAIKEGKRFQGTATTEELIGLNAIKIDKAKQSFIPEVSFNEYVKGKTNGEAFYKWAQKHPVQAVVVAFQGLAEPGLRALSAVEAVTKALHAGGMDEAARSFYYNEALRMNDTETLKQLNYDRAALWEKAKARASLNASEMRNLGIEVTKGSERVQALEAYYENLPKQVMVDMQKRSSLMVLNGPAAGYAGDMARIMQAATDVLDVNIGGKNFKPGKYLVAFSNAAANMTNLMLETTPIAAGSAFFPRGPRSPMERSMHLSSAIVSTALLSGLAAKALENLDKAEGERSWDLIGKYSDDPRQVAQFEAAGGKRYSIRIGNYYIPYNDTQFGISFAAIASIIDLKRQGKLSDEDLHSRAGVATALAAGGWSMLKAPTQISFMKTLSSIQKSIEQGNADALARYVIGVEKGFIPGAGALKTISRYTDNPVEARKDIQSALVEGIPYMQSHGIPGVVAPLPALNRFGEVITSQDYTGLPPLHRVFSSKVADIDSRWLSDNGYTIPDPYQVLTKKNTTLKGLGFKEGLTTRQEHALAMAASQANREVVAQFRTQLGSSAFNEKIQKQLNKAIRRNYAVAAVKLGVPAIESSEASGQVE